MRELRLEECELVAGAGSFWDPAVGMCGSTACGPNDNEYYAMQYATDGANLAISELNSAWYGAISQGNTALADQFYEAIDIIQNSHVDYNSTGGYYGQAGIGASSGDSYMYFNYNNVVSLYSSGVPLSAGDAALGYTWSYSSGTAGMAQLIVHEAFHNTTIGQTYGAGSVSGETAADAFVDLIW